MKLAIMQPYFLPYIGYFQLINAVDKFIIFDVVQYIKHGWMNRNRILSPKISEGWQYIIVPIKKISQDTLIKDVKINIEAKWLESIFGKLSYYKKIRAPYYDTVIDLISNFNQEENLNLVNLNIDYMNIVCNYLDIRFNYEICSNNPYDFSNIKDSGDWAFKISKEENTSLYINPIGGFNLFNRNKFLSNGMDIKFLKTKDIVYKQSKRDFISSLSILDVLMFNSKDEIKKMLNVYELV